MNKQKKQIAIWATTEEVRNMQIVKEYYKRSNDADTLRYLINSEAQKILTQNISIKNPYRELNQLEN